MENRVNRGEREELVGHRMVFWGRRYRATWGTVGHLRVLLVWLELPQTSTNLDCCSKNKMTMKLSRTQNSPLTFASCACPDILQLMFQKLKLNANIYRTQTFFKKINRVHKESGYVFHECIP